MKFSIVIPTVNQYKMLFEDCLNSFERYHGKTHEVIVVDDGSQPKLQQEIEAECRRRGYIFLKNEKNSGFPITCNKGMRVATGEIIILVNNDIVFTQDIITPMEKSFERDEKIGITGALLFYPHGNIQHGGIKMVGKFGFTHRGWHKFLDNAPEVKNPEYLIGVTGAIFGLRKTMLDQIGMFDEQYFLACDDTQMCLRAWIAGWRVFYNPDIRAIHAEGATRGRTDAEKQSKHRVWWINELETNKKFYKYLEGLHAEGKIDLAHSRVSEANGELLSQSKKISVMHESKMEFQADTTPSPIGFSVSKEKKTILVRRTGAMGDVIMATGVIRKLKEMNPESNIVFSTHSPQVFRSNPHVTSVVRDTGGIHPHKFYDLDMTYENDPKTPIWQAYSKKVFGEPVSELNPEIYSNDFDFAAVQQKLSNINFGVDRVAVVHMGVSWMNRTWPRHKWIDVVRNLCSSGFKVVTVGAGEDFRSDLFSGVTNMVGRFDIFELRELIKRSNVFAGIDSGPLHVAQTTDVPIVSLFTVANPMYRIFQRSAKTVALVPTSDCRFCLHDQPPPVTFCACKFSTNHCLGEIKVEEVIKEINASARY